MKLGAEICQTWSNRKVLITPATSFLVTELVRANGISR